MLLIKKCKNDWCKLFLENLKVGLKKESLWGLLLKFYFLYLAVQILSKTKYQTAFNCGSTIASVRAIIKET